jgi:hypothetical protein
MSRSHVRNFRITAADVELIPGQVIRKFGISEFLAKPTEAEAELKKIEATCKTGGKK